MIINQKISFAIKESNKEGEDNISCEKNVYYVIHQKERAWQVSQKCKFKRADPGRVDNQENQEYFPDSEEKMKGENEINWLVSSILHVRDFRSHRVTNFYIPVMRIIRRNSIFPQLGSLVYCRSKRWQQITGEAVDTIFHWESIVTEAL